MGRAFQRKTQRVTGLGSGEDSRQRAPAGLETAVEPQLPDELPAFDGIPR